MSSPFNLRLEGGKSCAKFVKIRTGSVVRCVLSRSCRRCVCKIRKIRCAGLRVESLKINHAVRHVWHNHSRRHKITRCRECFFTACDGSTNKSALHLRLWCGLLRLRLLNLRIVTRIVRILVIAKVVRHISSIQKISLYLIPLYHRREIFSFKRFSDYLQYFCI